MKILIIDDDPALRRILQAQLIRAGHDVVEAADGQAAWDILQTDPIRLVITDWMMPVMDGPQLVRRIREAIGAEPFPNYVYIILLTAKVGKNDVVIGLESGADDYLTKPFDPRELRARVAIGERIINLETSLSDARRQMEILAMQDGVTGLLNRRAIHQHAEAELSRTQRHHAPVSLVLLDIDHFKLVNDQFGHLVGDQALRMVADVLVEKKRPYDWAGRWGGEEFLLVLPRTTLAEAQRVAERVRLSVAATNLTLDDNQKVNVEVSLGVTSTSGNLEALPSLDTLLQQADEALYHAKETGRNRVSVYDPSNGVMAADSVEKGAERVAA
jgi:two-component system chemotaxis response regulator CheY